MKYMGSKRSMLQNGLGAVIRTEGHAHARFVDLFCGSGAVAWFAAETLEFPVLGVDLQEFAAALARAVVARTEALTPETFIEEWHTRALRSARASRIWSEACDIESVPDMCQRADRARELCPQMTEYWPLTRAYGGHYYSPRQALLLDALRRAIPASTPEKDVALAALIWTASRCAAAPGHTAQPFKPSPTAGKYIELAWNRDPLDMVAEALAEIAPRHAQVAGGAGVADAADYALELAPTDLVFVDPPYSEVQYSRFYHVLETLVRGQCGPVDGRGRYPPIEERPQSDFCKKSTSDAALWQLLGALHGAGCTVILTFPSGESSNGLSGETVLRMVNELFEVRQRTVNGQFSTLGGNTRNRAARQASEELLLLMKPQ